MNRSKLDADTRQHETLPQEHDALQRQIAARRRLLKGALGAGTVMVLGGVYSFSDTLTAIARAETRPDGRARLPPGQRVLSRLKPMGGQPGSPKVSDFRLKVHGEVEHPFEVDFRQLLAFPQSEVKADVHCVTGWSLLDMKWRGVKLLDLAKRAGVKDSARHVIFEAAHGYTANIPRKEALKPNVMLVHRHDGRPLGRTHGAPVRGLVPDLYFWKSAKWLTGIRFVRKDNPGYWETRGYHNHANPWREERHG